MPCLYIIFLFFKSYRSVVAVIILPLWRSFALLIFLQSQAYGKSGTGYYGEKRANKTGGASICRRNMTMLEKKNKRPSETESDESVQGKEEW